jgi:hypothetical protein
LSLQEASAYCRSVSPTCATSLFPIWIRPTTGELCADLVSSNTEIGTSAWEHIRASRFENLSLDSPDAEAILISNFHEGDYHELCSVPPIAKFKAFSVSNRFPTDWLGSMIFRSNSTWFRLTEPLRLGGYEGPLTWNHTITRAECEPKVLANSWIRYCGLDTDNLLPSLFVFKVSFQPSPRCPHRCRTSSGHSPYVLASTGKSHFHSTSNNLTFRGLR